MLIPTGHKRASCLSCLLFLATLILGSGPSWATPQGETRADDAPAPDAEQPQPDATPALETKEAPDEQGNFEETRDASETYGTEESKEDVVCVPGTSTGEQEHVPRYVLEDIELKGNNKTRERIILREVGIKKGTLFAADDVRLEETRYRLLATGFFYHVEISLKKGAKRGYVVMVVEVQERNTIVVEDLVFGFSEITPYGSIAIAERSLFGAGLELSAAFVASKDQWGIRIGVADRHFVGTNFGLFGEGLFSDAKDYFGTDNVHIPRFEGEVEAAIVDYTRAGGKIGTGYSFPNNFFLSVAYRLEVINAKIPAAAVHTSYGQERPIEFGHLHRGQSILSSIILGIDHDTRDSTTLVYAGRFTSLDIELAAGFQGASYEFTKLTLGHDEYFRLPRRQVIKASLFMGYVSGNAPFFNQFFVGDFSSFVPSRVLELNFSHLAPSIIESTIQEMRYEDLAASIGVEYSIALYRGSKFFYGIDAFVSFGLFALASREDLQVDPEGYSGIQAVPLDLTADFGVRIDTEYGLFTFSFANVMNLIPGPLNKEAAE